MTANRQTAFQAGSGITSGPLLTTMASMDLVPTFVWVVWIAMGNFGVGKGRVTLFDLIWNTLRASIMLLALRFYPR